MQPQSWAFYRKYFEAKGELVPSETGAKAVISVGPSTHFVFTESQDPLLPSNIEKQAGVHVCVYIAKFQESYNRLKDSNLIWTNPRFTYLDTCDTYGEARMSRQFRFKTFIDSAASSDTDKEIFELEHETRALTHAKFLSVLVNTS